MFPAHYELPYIHPKILKLSAKVQMRARWDNKESLVKAAPSFFWMVWSVLMHSHLTDINKLLLLLAEATQSWEFLYWLLNQQNSWLGASSSSLSGHVQAGKNTTWLPKAELAARNGFIDKHTAAWRAIPAAGTTRYQQHLTALANESSSELQAHIHMHLYWERTI